MYVYFSSILRWMTPAAWIVRVELLARKPASLCFCHILAWDYVGDWREGKERDMLKARTANILGNNGAPFEIMISGNALPFAAQLCLSAPQDRLMILQCMTFLFCRIRKISFITDRRQALLCGTRREFLFWSHVVLSRLPLLTNTVKDSIIIANQMTETYIRLSSSCNSWRIEGVTPVLVP